MGTDSSSPESSINGVVFMVKNANLSTDSPQKCSPFFTKVF